ncbi:MAG: hypothetical protein KF729_36210, partial [Sandaracinaceae bacterium]|nr:hypothetical protein [Sandaracinaceae bacterium]
MESHRRPIRELAEALRPFVGARGARLFHVTTDAHLYASVLELVMGFEHHADNRGPFFLLDAPYRADGGCWDDRAAAVRAAHAKRREAMAAHGYALDALEPVAGASARARFGATVSAALAGARSALRGATLVLAPGLVEDARAFDADLTDLARALPDVRFVVVEREACSIGAALARELQAGHGRALVDETEACRELEAKLDAASAAPPDAPSAA